VAAIAFPKDVPTLAIAADLSVLIDRSLPHDDAERLKLFAQRLFARESRERLESLSPERRLELARSAYEFFALRTDLIAVRVTPDSGGEGITIVESVMPDCPFIVDSLLEYFHHLGAPLRSMMHPVLHVARDTAGHIVSLEQASGAERGESMVHAELELEASVELADRIAGEVRMVLTEVHQATGDFERMTARALQICEETAAERELVEVRDFLRWLVQGGFVFLGYRRYRVNGTGRGASFAVVEGSELGIMRDHDDSRFRTAGSLDEISSARRKLFFEGPPLVIGKARAESLVHRRAPMDSATIRRTSTAGRVDGFDHFVGLFTSKAYAEEAQHIPVLRAKLRQVLEAEGAQPGSHDWKEIVTAFNTFPKDELFRAPIDELREQLRIVLDLKSEVAVRLKILPDVHRDSVIALVVMPREAFSAEVRLKIQNALAHGLRGTLVYYYLALGEGYTARLHFCFNAEPPRPQKIKELEAEVTRLSHRWEDRLYERLVEKFGAARGRALAAVWSGAFPPEYKAATSATRAVADIDCVEQLIRSGRGFAVEAVRGGQVGAGELRFIGVGDTPPMLSELMPTLQNFAVRVLSEDFHVFKPEREGRATTGYVQAFSVQGPGEEPLSNSPGAGLIAQAITAVRDGLAEDDPLNALVLSAGLNWRELALLRAYLAAAFQMRLAPARPALRRVLLAHPELARALFEIFAARMDPGRETAPDEAARLRAAYLEKLSAVENIADDRVARTLLSMVEATVRTNYFCEMPAPDPYIALKFESAKIANLADTPPLYEIHVSSPRMEGCHLRAGRVARGGIRFSDRPDDFRTEILDLMKTQTVKNAIIVPIGSKGGFVVKRPAPSGPPGVEAYQTLMRAMLDLTDNLTAAGIVHPPRVKVLDSDGPYLVVAADKGTASFSDIADAIALERGFWLGDAFASGGEHGFDHKAMGITARGAWESARRHLREMGRELDRGAPVTTVGIGDMSGDVFGNGMLLSRNLKLVAAFDHRNIFIDPDPDPAASFAERNRLFEKPHSSWDDYDRKLISAGGGVHRRGEKRIELSAQARAVLGCDAAALDGESLVAAILRAPVDLLYNGGIGTYVRASAESDEQVGDHANDACRIAAAELRARVVVEGGNLGFTQQARIEYALSGGRINTDAIDNSAGVDTSDHEVNLKILLEPEVASGALKFAERNRTLAAARDEVAQSVLRDNHDQVLSLTLEQTRSRGNLGAFRDHLQAVEERGLLRRHEEALPSREALSERHARYAGLTRPELALVTAYTKIDLVKRLDDSPIVDDTYLVGRFLVPYFPASLAGRFAAAIPGHRLRRELIATRLVNEAVDAMGSTFIFSMVRDHGVEADAAVRAWLIASDVIALPERAERIKRGEPAISADAELHAFLALERAGRSATAWALRNCEPALAIGAAADRFRSGFSALGANFQEHLAAGERERFEQSYRDLRAAVGDGEMADELARLGFADHLLDVLSLSQSRAIDVTRVTGAYFGLAAQFDFARLESALAGVNVEDRWERRAAQELGDELREARIALCCAALADGGAAAALEQIARANPRLHADVERLFAELAAMPTASLPAVHVAVRALSRLAQAA
jgi:glutamate dehydrogenase